MNAHLLTTERQYRQDWRNGTLARIAPRPEPYRWTVPLSCIAGLLAAWSVFG